MSIEFDELDELERCYIEATNMGEEPQYIIILSFCCYCGANFHYSKPSPTDEELTVGGEHLVRCIMNAPKLAAYASYN